MINSWRILVISSDLAAHLVSNWSNLVLISATAVIERSGEFTNPIGDSVKPRLEPRDSLFYRIVLNSNWRDVCRESKSGITRIASKDGTDKLLC
jgi:hypothetical protein